MSMPGYIEVIINNISSEQSALLIAILSDFGFDGFEEQDNILKAYITNNHFNETAFTELMQHYNFDYDQNTLKLQNWNTLWEENFEPVMVSDFVVVRTDFHKALKSKTQYELIITPKMSFGTGHHATTYLMLEQMRSINFDKKWVLDFGTGTGILAILAEKLGASNVTAIDNDEWSIENAEENIQRNNCNLIQLHQADNVDLCKEFDVILANINKNIILQNLHQLSACLHKNGYLVISGLLAADEQDLLFNAVEAKLIYINTMHREQWIAIRFTR